MPSLITFSKNMFEGIEARDDYIDKVIREKKKYLEKNHFATDDGLRVHN